MKTSLMIVMVLACWTLPAAGRVGETLEQCILRYGEPSKNSTPPFTLFIKGDFILSIAFQNSRAAIIFFEKTEHETTGIPIPISDTEIEVLLKANGGEKRWKQIPIGATQKGWMTEDGSLIAIYNAEKRNLLIGRKDARPVDAQPTKEEQERKKLEGF